MIILADNNPKNLLKMKSINKYAFKKLVSLLFILLAFGLFIISCNPDLMLIRSHQQYRSGMTPFLPI